MDNNAIEFIYHQHGHTRPITSFYHGRDYTISGDRRGIVQIWDSTTTAPIATIYAHRSPIASLSMLGTDVLVTASRDSTIKIWSLKSFDLLVGTVAHISALLKIEVSDGYIYSIGIDDTIKRWLFKDGDLILDTSTKASSISDFFILGDKILTTTADGLISIHDLKTLKFLGYLRLNAAKVAKAINNMFKQRKRKDNQAEFFSRIARRYGIPVSDAQIIGDRVVCAHHFGLISIWETKKWRNIDAYFAHESHITGMAKIVDNSGKVFIATASLNKELKIHDPDKKRIIFSKELPYRPSTLVSGKDNNTIVLGFETGAINIFDNQLNPLIKLPSVEEISSASFSPLGIIIGLKSGRIKVLSLDDFSTQKSLKLFNHDVKGLIYTNGKIVAVSAGGKIKVLNTDLQTIKEIDLDFRPEEVSYFRHYLTLKVPFVFDTKTLEVIKGTVSEDTKRTWNQQLPYNFQALGTDLIISIRSTDFELKADSGITKEDQEFLKDTLKKLIETKDMKPFKRRGLVIFNPNLSQSDFDGDIK